MGLTFHDKPTECTLAMSNISLELDCARAILKTYHQVNDTPLNQTRGLRPLRPPIEAQAGMSPADKEREQALESEVTQLKEKYALLQHELSDRDERLARLNRQLEEGTNHMARLQEDYENVIYQLQRK